MLSLRLLVLFIHVTAVIVALGGSLFSTFALAPVLAEELDAAARLRVARRVIQRLGVIVFQWCKKQMHMARHDYYCMELRSLAIFVETVSQRNRSC